MEEKQHYYYDVMKTNAFQLQGGFSPNKSKVPFLAEVQGALGSS